MKRYIFLLLLFDDSAFATPIDPAIPPTSFDGDTTADFLNVGSPQELLSGFAKGLAAPVSSDAPLDQTSASTPVLLSDAAQDRPPSFLALLPESARRWPPENRASMKLLVGADRGIVPENSSLIPLVTKP